jgi:CDP-diacylglycerol---glycerol-3-phosphate 3-phosphatidyltransferase
MFALSGPPVPIAQPSLCRSHDEICALMTKTEPPISTHAYLTPANGMTVLRMLATPVMLILITNQQTAFITCLLWIVLCSTDFVDGMLARRYGVTSSGAFLDPLADKILVLGAMIVLVVENYFSFIPVAIIAAREIGMSVYRSVAGTKGVSIPARKSAKVKTFLQQVAVGFAVAPWFGEHQPVIARTVLWIATALTVTTGLQYFQDARSRRLV